MSTPFLRFLLLSVLCMNVATCMPQGGGSLLLRRFPALGCERAGSRMKVQRLRGGEPDPSPVETGGRGLLVMDIGAQNTRAAMSALPGTAVPGLSSEGLATLVQVLVVFIIAVATSCSCVP